MCFTLFRTNNLKPGNTFVPIDFVLLFNSLLNLLVTEHQIDQKYASDEFLDKWRKKFCNSGTKVNYYQSFISIFLFSKLTETI